MPVSKSLRLRADLIELGLLVSTQSEAPGSSVRRAIRMFQQHRSIPSTPKSETATIRQIHLLAEAARRVTSDQERNRIRRMAGGRASGTRRRDESPRNVVQGRVVDTAGAPLVGLRVQAFVKRLRHEEPLADSTTDASGHYVLRRSVPASGTSRREPLQAVIRVHGRSEAALGSVSTRLRPDHVETVNLVVPTDEGRVAEYEGLSVSIAASLDDVTVDALTEDDVTFLARATRIPAVQIAFLSVAHRHARVTGVAPEIFYGFFRQDLPTALPALVVQKAAVLVRALQTSVRANVIPTRFEGEIDKAVATLHQHPARHVLEGSDPRSTALRGLFSAARLSSTEQGRFLDAYVRHQGPVEDLWKEVAASLAAEKVADLQHTLQLGLITGNNVRLVEALRARAVVSPRDLARLGRDGFKQLIESAAEIVSSIPSLHDRETAEEKASRYTETIFDVLNEAFPTTFVAAGLKHSTDGAHRDVSRLLTNVPELELRDEHIDRFLARHGDKAFEGVPDRTRVTDELKRFQRIMRITPRYEHVQLLLQDGLDSANAIATMSKAAFMERFAPSIGSRLLAEAYYEKAVGVVEASSAVTTSLMQSAHDLLPIVISPLPDAVKTHPTITTLFGSFGLCECRHCRSVYGPAAYFVDLLEFLNPAAGSKPLAALRQRRPDLEHIPLTCDNTNTPLPYLDLVNEILEFYVVHGELTKDAAKDTANATADELSVTPQHTIEEAYDNDALAGAAASPLLPFHRPLEVSRLYLTHLGVPRHQVMQVFQKSAAPSDLEIALESLRISSAEKDILTGADTRPLREFYGYLSDTTTFVNDAGESQSEPWLKNIARVLEFLKRTGTSYDELVELMTTDFLAGGGPGWHLKTDKKAAECDLSKTSIVNLTGARLARIHRLVRLTRKLGWRISDVDRALPAFQANDITLEFLQRVAGAQSLQQELKWPVPDLWTLWTLIPTQGEGTLYQRLFQNKAVFNPPDADFALNASGTELLAAAAKTLSDKTPALLAAFRISEEELIAIRAAAGLADDMAPLNLDNLTSLHRFATLARALKITIWDLLSLMALTGTTQFTPSDPADLVAFVARVHGVRRNRFTVAQLDYLYRSIDAAKAPLAPQDSAEACSKRASLSN